MGQKIFTEVEILEIIRLYLEENFSLRQISGLFKTNHHFIERILKRNNVKIDSLRKHKGKIKPKKEKQKPHTEETKKKISLAGLGRIPWDKNKHLTEDHKNKIKIKRLSWCNIDENRRKNLISHSRFNISLSDISRFKDTEKLMCLNHTISPRNDNGNKRYNVNTEWYLQFLDKFYFDEQFNRIYNLWLLKNKNIWYQPSIDHKISKKNGGTDNIDNLRFLTWFENKSKSSMNDKEWRKFKIEANLKGDLFIDE